MVFHSAAGMTEKGQPDFTPMISQGVLVLNRNWVAVHVCNVRRAISLVCQDMARVVASDYRIHDFDSWRELSLHVQAHGDQYIHTPNFRILVPEVILLTGFNRMPPRTVKFNRRNIYMRDHYTCQYCGVQPGGDELTIDHVVPRAQGGISSWTNCVLACVACNKRKADRTPAQAGFRLRKPPVRPAWKPLYAAPSMRIASWDKFVSEAYWNVTLAAE